MLPSRVGYVLRTLMLTLAGAATGHSAMAAEQPPAPEGAAGKPGYVAGGYRILPEIELTGYYDDNIYATKRARESDLIAVFTPSVSLESLWERHSLELGAGASIGRYVDNSDEDYQDVWAKASGQLDLSDATQLYGGAAFSVNHESRDSKEGAQQQIDEPTTYTAESLQLGLNQQWGASAFKFGVTRESLDYDNVGRLYNDDRDRTVTGLGLRFSQPIADRTQVFVQGILNQRSYDDAVDQNGYDKDSDGYNAILGLSREYTGGHRIEAYAGYLEQRYDDDRFDRVEEPDYGLDLRWFPSKNTQFKGKLERSLNETTEIGSSGYLYTAMDLQLEQLLHTDWLGYVNYNLGKADFQDVGREDTTQTVSLGLKYYMSPRVMLTGSYSHINNDSNDRNTVSPATESYDFTRNLFFLTLRARFSP